MLQSIYRTCNSDLQLCCFSVHTTQIFLAKNLEAWSRAGPFPANALGLYHSAIQPYCTEPAYSATWPACFSLHPTCSSARRLLKLNKYRWANDFLLPQSSWLLKNGCCVIHLKLPNLWRLLCVPTYIGSVAIISCVIFYSFKFDTPSSHTKSDAIPPNEESNF